MKAVKCHVSYVTLSLLASLITSICSIVCFSFAFLIASETLLKGFPCTRSWLGLVRHARRHTVSLSHWQQGGKCVRTNIVGRRKKNEAKAFFQMSSNSHISDLPFYCHPSDSLKLVEDCTCERKRWLLSVSLLLLFSMELNGETKQDFFKRKQKHYK